MAIKGAVFVVVLAKDAGVVVAVFSALSKASEYIANHPYNGYICVEKIVDEEC